MNSTYDCMNDPDNCVVVKEPRYFDGVLVRVKEGDLVSSVALSVDDAVNMAESILKRYKPKSLNLTTSE